MSIRKPLPTPLTPYLRLPPEHSQILLTSTLGTSTTWLVSRFIGAVVGSSKAQNAGAGAEGIGDGEGREDAAAAVVLVSWMREEAFWRGEVRRGTGLDLPTLTSNRQFAFLDAMALLAESSKPDTAISTLETAISAAIHHLTDQEKEKKKKILLILDAPDALLATASTTPSALCTLLLTLRQKVHSTVLTLSSDLPLVSAAAPALSHGRVQAPPTPLEIDSATFLVQQAHASRFVMGVRELETGAARDVSGVVRVSRGGDVGWDWDGDGDGVAEMEALFLVQRDGGVKVFERGSEG